MSFFEPKTYQNSTFVYLLAIMHGQYILNILLHCIHKGEQQIVYQTIHIIDKNKYFKIIEKLWHVNLIVIYSAF